MTYTVPGNARDGKTLLRPSTSISSLWTRMKSGWQNEAKRPWPDATSKAVQAVRQDETTTPGEFGEPL